MLNKTKILLLSIVFLFVSMVGTNLHAASVGQSLGSVKIINPSDKPAWIPQIGKKVLTIMYTDPDEKDVNDPLSNAIKGKNYSKEKYLGIGIGNCKDTWIPNAAIRYKARGKAKQFKGSVILLDEKRAVSKKWGLGNCDDLGVVIVVGKDRKIKFIKKIKNKAESRAIISAVLKVIDEEIAK
ncbi:MAG: hypothetical protein GY754_11735 [bacterium]|nr:hypothetical protein [bacterium]